jgi:hypothetical protein
LRSLSRSGWHAREGNVAGTTTSDSLQSGTMQVLPTTAQSRRSAPGQAYVIEPGHHAWIVGDEPVVGFEFDWLTAEEHANG